jgi:four helix bundle protein
MARSIICQRAEVFAVRILRVRDLMDSRGASGRHVASELRRCGPSIGANAAEAQEGQTKRDFIAKLSIARKESRETLFWLRTAIRTNVVSPDEVDWELGEAGQLRAMIVAALRTAQSNPYRGDKPRKGHERSSLPGSSPSPKR